VIAPVSSGVVLFQREVDMLKKEKIKAILKRAIAPVTIMFIPHSNTRRTLNLNIRRLAS